MRIALSCSVVLTSLALAGCALSPPPTREEIKPQALPNLAPPSMWTTPGANTAAPTTQWLDAFPDPRLQALVREAIAYNSDLRIAAARIELAAAQAKLAGSNIYPAVNALAHGGLGKSGGDNSGLNAIGLFANWEIDLWGRVRYQREAGAQQYASAVLDAQYATQSIA